MIAAESLPTVRARIGVRLREMESRARQEPRIDIGARMHAIRSKVAATA